MNSIQAQEVNKYSISEVSAMIGIKEPTLRKWEKDYYLNIPRDELNHRYYTEKEISILKTIIELKEKGVNIHGIRRVLKNPIEPVKQRYETIDVDKVAGNEVLMILLKELSEIIFRREEELIEKVKDEVVKELTKQNSYIREENQKLMKYLEQLRNNTYKENPKKGFFQRLLAKKNIFKKEKKKQI